MSDSVLVAYATRYGSTEEVAGAIAQALRECGLTVDIQPAREVDTITEYSAVVLGAPLFIFHWHKDALGFLSRHHVALTQRPLAIFSLGPVHDPRDEQEWRNSWDQLKKELADFPWLAPVSIELFGGKYDPTKLRFPVKLLAGNTPASDMRDWTAIRAWATGLASNLAAKREPVAP